MTTRIGLDIGGVIMNRGGGNSGASFRDETYLAVPPIDGAFEGLAALVDSVFHGRVALVSSCSEDAERKTWDWFEHFDFYHRTGVRRENVRFCRLRPEKAAICAELGITHFVDDRSEVLSHLAALELLYLFAPSAAELEAASALPRRVIPVAGWSELLAELGRQ